MVGERRLFDSLRKIFNAWLLNINPHPGYCSGHNRVHTGAAGIAGIDRCAARATSGVPAIPSTVATATPVILNNRLHSEGPLYNRFCFYSRINIITLSSHGRQKAIGTRMMSGTGRKSLPNKNKQPPALHEVCLVATTRFPDHAATTKETLSQPPEELGPLL